MQLKSPYANTKTENYIINKAMKMKATFSIKIFWIAADKEVNTFSLAYMFLHVRVTVSWTTVP